MFRGQFTGETLTDFSRKVNSLASMASSQSEILYNIKKLDGTDFPFWKKQILLVLVHKKQVKPLKLKGERPEGMDKDDWEELEVLFRNHVDTGKKCLLQPGTSTWQKRLQRMAYGKSYVFIVHVGGIKEAASYRFNIQGTLFVLSRSNIKVPSSYKVYAITQDNNGDPGLTPLQNVSKDDKSPLYMLDSKLPVEYVAVMDHTSLSTTSSPARKKEEVVIVISPQMMRFLNSLIWFNFPHQYVVAGTESTMARDDSRKRKRDKASMHPLNKYAENPPDFNFLASHYPSFKEYVSIAPNGRAKIDWTDFNATRELTRVLLAHDFGIHWWIPDGQLCPTVPNRANYIHWIQDLLTNCPAPWHTIDKDSIWGLDIGTGANCIYPLLGAAIHGWHFVGTDVTDTALEWARWNVQQNSDLAGLISIRSVGDDLKGKHGVISNEQKEDEKCNVLSDSFDQSKKLPSPAKAVIGSAGVNVSPLATGCCPELEIDGIERFSFEHKDLEEVFPGDKNLPILVGVLLEAERFDFCMCNPPFFASMKEAGMNPHTACGGTSAEMVYPGGEEGFISKMIEDSEQLKEQIHWFTTLVGRKVNLKILTSKLRERKVQMLRTTEFVQGRTCRWGLAWTYNTPPEDLLQRQAGTANTNNVSFMIQGLPRQCKAYDVLQALASSLPDFGVTCEVDVISFMLKGSLQDNLERQHTDGRLQEALPSGENDAGHFTITVFEQAPGALLVKGKLAKEKSLLTGKFNTMLSCIEQRLKHLFCAKKEQFS
ncbi:hypothetical protein L7F22_029727 [Adiantum nelumboides]|nr:hypothetical protein [Adiantum nelumboides]